MVSDKGPIIYIIRLQSGPYFIYYDKASIRPLLFREMQTSHDMYANIIVLHIEAQWSMRPPNYASDMFVVVSVY